MSSLMTEAQWQAAERREPSRTYIMPDFSACERLEMAASVCFVAMAAVGLGVAWRALALWQQYLELIAAAGR